MAKIEVHAANFEFIDISTGGIGAGDQFTIRGKETFAPMHFRDLTHLEIVTQDTYKKTSASIGSAVAGGLLLGGVGALAGAYFGGNKNTVTFAADWSDGKKMMATVPADVFKTMQGAVMRKQFAQEQIKLAEAEHISDPHALAQAFGTTASAPPAAPAYQDPNANLRLKDGERSPSGWLWIGFFIMPAIFAWPLFNKKYKKSTRYIAMAWIALFFLIVIASKS